MTLVVTGVGFLIHLYSTKYMEEDPGYHRFFAYLNLFIFSMLVLILGDSLPVLFVGWEGVGLCSYLLIGFWFEDEKNAAAGKKAFIANRIGDFGLLVAMGLLALLHAARSTGTGIEAGAREPASRRSQVWPIGICRRDASSGSPRHRPSRAVPGRAPRRSSASRCSSAAPARARRSRSTSGCRTRWPARRRSARSSTRPRW